MFLVYFSDIILLLLTGNYGKNENVEWTIVVLAGQVVRLDFYTFNTFGYSYSWADYVSGDYVRVYDSCTADNDKIIDTYYGPRSGYEHNLPSSILSTSNAIHINFTTDSYFTRQGFSATAAGVDLAGNMTLEYYLLKVKHVNK